MVESVMTARETIRKNAKMMLKRITPNLFLRSFLSSASLVVKTVWQACCLFFSVLIASKAAFKVFMKTMRSSQYKSAIVTCTCINFSTPKILPDTLHEYSL